MAKWGKVQRYLEEALLPHCSQPEFVSRWLSELRSSDDGVRLGICMAIDIGSKAIPAKTFAEVLSLISSGEPLESFVAARRTHPADLLAMPVSVYSQDQCGDSPVYARVLTMADFIKYYAGPSFGYTFAEVDEVRAVFLENVRQTLEDITTVWSGANNRVWIMPLEDLQATEASSSAEHATLINDMLGLGKCTGIGRENKPEMLYVVYPAGFCDGRCSQPTTLDAGWQGADYYVSFLGLDSWGRTHSCSGRLPPCRERVHAPIASLNSGFKLEYIGVSDALASDRSALLDEAYRRFDRLVAERGSNE